ncbi:MAG: hypothetical protein JXA60_06725 [Candidatus Coatesbacteria bacterium]|nr:hypothetical protein [Candidatus Coatesbacteria bacterium]
MLLQYSTSDTYPDDKPGMLDTNLFSVFTGLKSFSGDVSYHEAEDFLKLEFTKPDVSGWVKKLKSKHVIIGCKDYTKLYRQNGETRYILIKKTGNFTRFFKTEKDRITMLTLVNDEGKLFMTEVGVCIWEYYYRNNLLEKKIYYTNPSKIYGIEIFTYRKNSLVPELSTLYESQDCIKKSLWKRKFFYDKSGKIIKSEWRKNDNTE